jgi:hypothetical protein
MKNLKTAGLIIGAVLLAISAVYGCYWIAKSVSYAIFYEGMVEQTIREMVKPEYLIGK